jgi:hypothetical protein
MAPVCQTVAIATDLSSMIIVDGGGHASLVRIPSLKRVYFGYWYQIEPDEAQHYHLWVAGAGGVFTANRFLKSESAVEEGLIYA